jgi:acetyl esterase
MVHRRSSIAISSLFIALVLSLSTGSASAQVFAQNLSIQANVTYRVVDGQTLQMDTYVPMAGGPFPAVVMIHGGGFFQGDKDLNTGVSKYLADNGYAVFNINYRLAPAFPYPAAVEDSEAAVQWVRDHAADYNVNPQRIATFGSSAGGTLAVSVAAQGAGTTGSRVMDVVSWSGSLDMVLNAQLRPSDPLVQEGLSDYVGMPGVDVTSPGVLAALAKVEPLNLITKDSPPMFIANATHEFEPIENAQSFVAKLDQLGIPYQFLTPDTDRHALRYARLADPPTLDWLNRNLRDGALPSGGPTVEPSKTPATPETTPSSPTPTRTRTRRPQQTGGGSSAVTFLLIAAVVVVAGLLISLLVYRRRSPPRPPGF